MKLKPLTVLLIAGIITISAISIGSLTGIWQTKSEKIPAVFESGNYKGSYDPADIRGSYTFKEISSLYKIPQEDLLNAFSVPSNQADFACKDLESIYGDSDADIGTSSVRFFVAAYLGLPLELTEDTFLPQTAEKIIMDNGNPTDEQRTYLLDHVWSDDTQQTDSLQTSASIQTSTSSSASSSKGQGNASQKNADLPDLKGADYISDLCQTYNIPTDHFATAFGITTDEVNSLQVKNIKERFADKGVSVTSGSIKAFIAFYLGLQVDLNTIDSTLPTEACQVILDYGTPRPEQRAYVESLMK